MYRILVLHNCSSLLWTEFECLRLIIHPVQDGYRLQMVASLSQDGPTLLLTLFDGYTYSCDSGTSLLDDVYERKREIGRAHV